MVIYGASGLRRKDQAYDLLAWAVAEHWGMHPLPLVSRAQGGKPYFAQLEGREFNLSHSDKLAVCALCDTPVGIDIQVVKCLRPGLPQRVCSQQELEWLDAQGDFWSQFTLLWALKESRVKFTGSGLTRPISSIQIPLPEQGVSLYQMDGLWFGIYPSEKWRCAVCSQTPPPQEIVWLQ